MSNSSNEVKSDNINEKTAQETTSTKGNPKRNYNAISKDGDTLELSETGKKLGIRANIENLSFSGEKTNTDSGKKISDAALSGYSETKLKQLYASKQITKQQYEHSIKKKRQHN